MLLVWILVALIGVVVMMKAVYKKGQDEAQQQILKLQHLQFDLLQQIQRLRDENQSKILENQSLFERLVAQDEVIQHYQNDLKSSDQLLDHLKKELSFVADNYEHLLSMKTDITEKVGILEQELKKHKKSKEEIFNDLMRTTDELYSLRARLKKQILKTARQERVGSVN